MDNNRTCQPPFRLPPSISHFTQVCESRHALLGAIQAASALAASFEALEDLQDSLQR